MGSFVDASFAAAVAAAAARALVAGLARRPLRVGGRTDREHRAVEVQRDARERVLRGQVHLPVIAFDLRALPLRRRLAALKKFRATLRVRAGAVRNIRIVTARLPAQQTEDIVELLERKVFHGAVCYSQQYWNDCRNSLGLQHAEGQSENNDGFCRWTGA